MDRKNKNKLALSRDAVETIIGRVSNLEFLKNNSNVLSSLSEDENPDSDYYISAVGLLQVLCHHILAMYDKVNNTNTGGIWDVSKNYFIFSSNHYYNHYYYYNFVYFYVYV